MGIFICKTAKSKNLLQLVKYQLNDKLHKKMKRLKKVYHDVLDEGNDQFIKLVEVIVNCYPPGFHNKQNF